MNQAFFIAFGCLTMAFSRLEADLRILIVGLAFKGEGVVASAFMDRSQLGDNLSILRKLGRQYWGAEARIVEILKRTEKIRQRRNLFIHGLWSPGNFGEKDGFATVTDLRTSFEEDKDSRRWAHGQSERFSIHDFQATLDEVNLISVKVEELCKWFEEHEDIEFGYFGATAMYKPVFMNFDGPLRSE